MINRIDCYKVLFEMKKNGIDVERQIKMLSTSSTVPKEIIEFINDKRPLHIREFYETLRKKGNQKGSKLYKNIVKEKQDNSIEAAKTLSSLLTHILIKAETLELSEVYSFYKQARVLEINEALHKYFTEGDTISILEELKYIREDIKILENKEIK